MEICNGGFVSSISHCIFNTNLVMVSVNDYIKMFPTYLKMIYGKMENLHGPYPLGNGPFYLKTTWRVQRDDIWKNGELAWPYPLGNGPFLLENNLESAKSQIVGAVPQ